MKQFIDRLIEMLEEAKFPITDLKQGVIINGIQQTDDAILYSRAKEIINQLAEEFATEYEIAEEQRLILRLPVAEGNIVYVTDYTFECKHDYECPLSFDKYKCEEDIRCQNEYKKYHVKEAKFNHMMLEKIGKTVFLTKEEAEQALKQMGG